MEDDSRRKENIQKAEQMLKDRAAGKTPAPAELNIGTPPGTPEQPGGGNAEATQSNETGLAISGGGVVEPLGKIEDLKRSWAKFQAVKAAVIDAGDVQEVTRGNEKRAYIVKSGWRKIQVAYGIRTEVLKQVREVHDKTVMWNITVRASTRNGYFAEAVGSCVNNERCSERQPLKGCDRTGGDCNNGLRHFAHGEADMLMTAQTRATNRAISDLVGGGDVSAEEMQ